MTTKRDSIIERRFKAGESMADIARDYDLSRERVRQILGRRGVDTWTTTRARALAWAVEDVMKRGLSPVAAAKARGVGRDQVRRELAERGFDYTERRRAEIQKRRKAQLAGRGKTTCNRCGQEKSWSEMALDTDRHGNRRRRRHCKDCARKIVKSWYQANRGRNPEPTVTEMLCTRCGQVKPAGEFWRNAATWSGLQSRCKACSNEQRRQR